MRHPQRKSSQRPGQYRSQTRKRWVWWWPHQPQLLTMSQPSIILTNYFCLKKESGCSKYQSARNQNAAITMTPPVQKERLRLDHDYRLSCQSCKNDIRNGKPVSIKSRKKQKNKKKRKKKVLKIFQNRSTIYFMWNLT